MSQFFYYDTLRSTGDSNSRRGFLTEHKQWRKRNFIDLGDTGTWLQLFYFFPRFAFGNSSVSRGWSQSIQNTFVCQSAAERNRGGGGSGRKKIIMLPPLYFPHTQVAHFLFPRNFLSLTQKRKNIEQTPQSQFDWSSKNARRQYFAFFCFYAKSHVFSPWKKRLLY